MSVEVGQARIFHFRDPGKKMGRTRFPLLENEKFLIAGKVPEEEMYVVLFLDGERDRMNPHFIEYHSDVL